MSNPSEKQQKLLKQALEYDKAGINVMVAYYRGKSPPKGIEWKPYQNKRVLPEQLHEWFGDGKWRNMSGISGSISSGLTVVDFDAEEIYHRWAKKYSDLAKRLPTVKSARGYHIYMRSNLTKDEIGVYPKIDIKAKGLFSLPPSMHKSGVRYQWIIPLPEHVSELPLINPHDWKLSDFTDGIDGTEGIDGTDGNEGTDGTDANDGKEGNDGNEGVLKELSWGVLPHEVICLIEDAVEGTLPKQCGQRYFLIFLFCRMLKGIEHIKGRTAEELRFIAEYWHERALPNIKTKSIVMTLARFENGWRDAKFPPGEGKSLEIAAQAAFSSELVLPEFQGYSGDEIMRKLILLCLHLQLLAGPEGVWFVSTNKGPELFGVSHSWLATLLNTLNADKIIYPTKKYTTSRCTRYRFIGPSMELIKNNEIPTIFS